jgi:hypothetical protein
LISHDVALLSGFSLETQLISVTSLHMFIVGMNNCAAAYTRSSSRPSKNNILDGGYVFVVDLRPCD